MSTRLKRIIAKLDKTAIDLGRFHPETGNKEAIRGIVSRLVAQISKRKGAWSDDEWVGGDASNYGNYYLEEARKKDTIWDVQFPQEVDYINRYMADWKTQYEEAYSVVNEHNGKEVTIYRGMSVTAQGFRSLLSGRKGLGTHWSLNKQRALGFSLNTNNHPIAVVITAQVPSSDIHVSKSLFLRTYYPREDEINLSPGTKITVVSVEVAQWGKGEFDQRKGIKPATLKKLQEKLQSTDFSSKKFKANVDVEIAEYQIESHSSLYYTAKLANLLRVAEKLSDYDPKTGNQKKIAAIIAGILKLSGGDDKKDLYITEVARHKYKTAFPKQPEMWYEYTKSKLESYYEVYKEAYKTLKGTIKGGKVKIWRAMEVSSEFLDELATGNPLLGSYWSWEERAANVFADEHIKRTGSIPIKLAGVVSADKINWGTSLYYNMHPDFDNEKEIRLNVGTEITLVNVAVDLRHVEESDSPRTITKGTPLTKAQFDKYLGTAGDDFEKTNRLASNLRSYDGWLELVEKFWQSAGDYFFKNIDFKELIRMKRLPWFYTKWYRLRNDTLEHTHDLDNAAMINEMAADKEQFNSYSFEILYRNIWHDSTLSFMRKYLNGFIAQVKNTPELLHLFDKQITLLDPKVYNFKGKKYKA